MQNTFSIKLSNAYEYIDALESELKNHYKIDIHHNNDLCKGTGIISNGAYGDFSIYVNNNIKAVKNNGLFKRYADTLDFTNYIRTLFHEEQHIIQSVDIMYRHDSDAVQMAMKNLACEGNNDYYGSLNNNLDYHNGSTDRYNNNLSEIDAERTGIIKTYEFLKNNITADHAEELICKMVNDKIKHSDYFIKGYFNNISDIKDAFDAKYEKAKFSEIIHLVPRLRPSDVVKQDDDEYVKYLQSIIRDNPMDIKLMEMFWNEKDTFEKDRMVAGIVHHLHPEINYKKLYPCLANEDLSNEAVFGMKLPKPIQIDVFDDKKQEWIKADMYKAYNSDKLKTRIIKADDLHKTYFGNNFTNTEQLSTSVLNENLLLEKQSEHSDLEP